VADALIAAVIVGGVLAGFFLGYYIGYGRGVRLGLRGLEEYAAWTREQLAEFHRWVVATFVQGR
jgi:hypothetical protein